MSTINVYSLHTNGLSIETYTLDLLTCEQINHRTETYKTAKARRARAATLSETHTLASRIERHPTIHATAWMVREPGPDTTEYAVYFGGEFVGYAPTRADAESRIDDLVHGLLTRQDIAAKAEEQEAQSPEYEDADTSDEASDLYNDLCGDDLTPEDAAFLRGDYGLEDEHAAPLDCGDLHRNLSSNPADAYADLATLSESQLTRQAIAYAGAYDLDWQVTLSGWQSALR